MFDGVKFDQWLTTPPEWYDMERVTKEGFTDTCPESGLSIPTHIDELSCEDCLAHIGWSSEGHFIEFYGDESDKHYKCEDCHAEWLDNYYTE